MAYICSLVTEFNSLTFFFNVYNLIYIHTTIYLPSQNVENKGENAFIYIIVSLKILSRLNS